MKHEATTRKLISFSTQKHLKCLMVKRYANKRNMEEKQSNCLACQTLCPTALFVGSFQLLKSRQNVRPETLRVEHLT